MRILHLAYEDPEQPGSGGGSLRTREIYRRLSSRHQIHAVVAGYPGARARLEDGIHWVPLGLRTGKKLDQLSYLALLGAAVRHYPHDLLVEDFGPPWSVGFSPLFSRKPVIAMVNWFFTEEMSRKYKLPLNWIENLGLPLYKDFISLSTSVANQLACRRPGARVEVIPSGVEESAFNVSPMPPRHLLFVGRLDIAQKGLDLLLTIFDRVRESLGDQTPPLLIVGDGRDQSAVKREVYRLGLEGLVKFLGRVDGAAKYALMAQAYAVLMPSRFETFGIVGIESQAAYAPIVAFNVGPIEEVLGPGGGRLVPAFDIGAFAQEVLRLVRETGWHDIVRKEGRLWARRYNWDDIALRQEAHYRSVLKLESPTAVFHAQAAQP